MEQSGVIGLTVDGLLAPVSDFRDAPFCTREVFADMLKGQRISEDVVRGWIESYTLPTVKIGRRRVINLHRIFCQGDYDED